MGDASQPSFEAIFNEQLFTSADAALAAPEATDVEDLFAETGGTQVGGHVIASGHRPRFDEDTSQLPPEVSWTLQELVAAPHVSEDKSKKYWPVLLQHEELLRSRLSELGLILEINRERGFAFTRQAEDPSPHSRILLRTRTLSLAASTLALYLYNQYVLSPDDPVVETDDMIEHMDGYRPTGNTDEAGFRKKTLTAIKSLEEASIIKPVVGTKRYVIYGVITSILSADRVEALNVRYKALAAGTTVDTDAMGAAITPGSHTRPSTNLDEGDSREDEDE